MQIIRMSDTIAVISPLLVMVTIVELLSAWSGDRALASTLEGIRDVGLVGLVVWLAMRASQSKKENVAT